MLAALVAGCGGGGGSSAGGVGTATVSGVVTDSSGTPVEGAVVIVGTASWTATTGPDGSYVIPNIPIGTHPVKALKNGYDLGSLGSVTVSGAGTIIDNVTLPPPSGSSPALTGLTIDPSSGPSGTTVTVHVEVENVTSAGTVRLASPELEQTWAMTRPASGNTYTATVPITAKTGILKYRFFAAAYEGTRASVTNAEMFTLTGGATNANVTGVWKFFVNQTSPTNDNGTALLWIRQAADNTLTLFDYPMHSGGSVSGNTVSIHLTNHEGNESTFTGTVNGRQMAGTYTGGSGGSGTFVAFLAMEDGEVPASTGSGPVTLTTGQYFDLSSGRTLSTATAADFGVTLGASVGSIVSVPTDGIGLNRDHNIEGFRVDLAIQSSPLSSSDWFPSEYLYDTNSYVPATFLVKTAEGKYGLIWVSAANASGMTFRYQYPYASATPDTVGPSVPTGLTATAVSSTQVNLAWDANPEGDVTRYVLWRMPDNAIIYVGPSASPSYSNTGLTPGTAYTYRLAADDGFQGSGWGDPVIVTTPVATFSNASLSGEWYSAGMDVGYWGDSVGTGTDTFNGAGSISYSGVFSESDTGINQPSNWSTTYSVSANGDVRYNPPSGEPYGMDGKLALTGDFGIFAKVESTNGILVGMIVKPGSGMDNSSLSGRYWAVRYSMGATRQSGFYLNTFDGAGGYTYTGSYSDNASGGGVFDTGSRNYSVADNGAYSSATDVSTYDGGVSADGDVYVAARVQNPSQRAIGIGIKAGSSGYSTAGASGTYKFVYLAQDDTWGPVAVIGTITLNGAGGCTVTGKRASVSDPIANQTISRTGTYSVESDGRLTITTGDGVFDGGISADGNQFLAALVGGDGATQAVMIGTK